MSSPGGGCPARCDTPLRNVSWRRCWMRGSRCQTIVFSSLDPRRSAPFVGLAKTEPSWKFPVNAPGGPEGLPQDMYSSGKGKARPSTTSMTRKRFDRMRPVSCVLDNVAGRHLPTRAPDSRIQNAYFSWWLRCLAIARVRTAPW